MNIWKIEHVNKTPQGVKIAICLSSSESRGVILQPNQFVLAQEQMTASIDSQRRRGFINVEKFDNSKLMLELGVTYNVTDLTKATEPTPEVVAEAIVAPEAETESIEPVDKLQEAQKDADDYINESKD